MTPSGTSPDRDSRVRFPTLGMLWILYGLLRLISAIGLFVFTSQATLMFGALLNRVANPFALMDYFHFLYLCAIALAVVCGGIGIIAGLALMNGQRSSRTLGLIAGFLSLCNLPLGTTLGIYTLIVLIPMRTNELRGAQP
ncbi:MAG: hypothetical protein WA871_14255 [Candidatus Acidiferrales bacterium]